eukprot:TRINITY_DN1021_c0_g1_i1.p1 TRINITY_DN1021_c0_g1~~TRINITY_DN1021_c0_g1_i1.p1  ORF type:complete len:839 (-),score=263.30 TRINITY_DN1021_c0_g1_i1:223-2739(-)
MSVGGIDFGNAQSVMSLARKRGIDIVANEASRRATASYVSFDEKCRSIGDDAYQMAVRNFSATVFDFKRILGRSFTDPEIRAELELLPFKVAENSTGDIDVVIHYQGEEKRFSVEAVLGMLLRKLSTTCDKFNDGIRVTDYVLSVPSYYNEKQRRALLNAAKIGGMNCLRLINELTAAAVDYGMFRSDDLPEKEPETVLFIDFGHTALSAAVASVKRGELKMRSHASDPNLGSRNVDFMIYRKLAKEFKAKTGIDIDKKPKSRVRLLRQCEGAKKVLSTNENASIHAESLCDDQDLFSSLTREQLEEMCTPFHSRIGNVIREALRIAGIENEDLTAVEVIGGGSRMPFFKSLVLETTGKVAGTRLNGDESISRGCAMISAILSPNFRVRPFSYKDVVLMPVSMTFTSPAVRKEVALFQEKSAFPSARDVSLKMQDNFSIEVHIADPARLPKSSPSVLSRADILDVPSRPGEVVSRVRMDGSGCAYVDSATFVEQVEVEVEDDSPAKDEKLGEASSDDISMKKVASDVVDELEKKETESKDKGEKEMEMEGESQKKEENEGKGDSEMEVEEKPAKRTKTVKRTKKTPLRVVRTHLGMTDTMVKELIENEIKMQNDDGLVFETLACKNDVESYVYEMRDRLSMSLREYMEDEDRENFVSTLTDTEDWLYGDGEDAQKSVYLSKLRELKEIGDRVVSRYEEATNRNSFVAKFRSIMGNLDSRASATDGSVDHIDRAEIDEVVQMVRDGLIWIEEVEAGFKHTPLPVDPSVTCVDIQKRMEDIWKKADIILNKPKPAPKKEEENPVEQTKEKTETEVDEDKETMDVEEEVKKTEGVEEMEVD